MKIEFKKVERVCGHNTRVHESCKHGYLLRSQDLIHDYDVVVDGKTRACFVLERHRQRSYVLKTPDHGVRLKKTVRGQLTEFIALSQKSFRPIIEDMIGTGELPTPSRLSQLKKWREKEDAETKERIRKNFAERVQKEYGPQLYAKLKQLDFILDEEGKALLAKIEKEATLP